MIPLVRALVNDDLRGQFMGVGSLPADDIQLQLNYVRQLKVPYWFQLPSHPEEDMIRQFGYLLPGYESDGPNVLRLDPVMYRDVIEQSEPLLPDRQHARALHMMMESYSYDFFKTQQTAPATMAFSIRGIDGLDMVSEDMFRLFVALMQRVAIGQLVHLRPHCKRIVLCQDDPAVGLAVEIAKSRRLRRMSLQNIMQATDSIYPDDVIPAYHYCDDWRQLSQDSWYALWQSRLKIVHVDLITYPPRIDRTQADAIMSFLQHGGGLALGVLPRSDSMYQGAVLDELYTRLTRVFSEFNESGIDTDLVAERSMISTQCGIPRVSTLLAREIHEASVHYPDVLERVARQV